MNPFSSYLCGIFFFFFLTTCNAFESVDELTLEEKVGQLLMVHFNGENVNNETKELIQTLHIGHIIYYNWANGLYSPEQIDCLSNGLQKLAAQNRIPLPLIIAVDQEGGIVSRLQEGFTSFPGNKVIAETGDPSLAELCAYATGLELRSVGINMNLAPVVDINSNPRNPVIGIRSFGETPEIVISYAEKSLQGYHRAGIITALKHFPGHGDVQTDSHSDLPILRKSLSDLEKMELLPFNHFVDKTDAIMTGHLMVPSIDPAHCATLSPSLLNLLRLKVGFKGVIISDSLVMEGVLKNGGSIENTCIQAFNAGCDILLLGGKLMIGSQKELSLSDIKKIHSVLVDAVKIGIISEKRLNQSVQRILALKKKYLFQEKVSSFDAEKHCELAKDIAKKALKIISHPDFQSISLQDKQIALFIPKSQQKVVDQTSLSKIGKSSSSFIFEDNDIDDYTKPMVIANESEVTIFCSYNAWKNPNQLNLIQTLLTSGKPLILIPLRDPLDAVLVPEAHMTLIPFSPTVHSIEAVYEFLSKLSPK